MSSLDPSSTSRSQSALPDAGAGQPTRSERYWRTLEEWADTPEFRERLASEFPHGAAPDDFRTNPLSRRRWLQLMGASLALAGVTGCRWEEEEIAPFVHRPLGRAPGEPQHYVTALAVGRRIQGLLATCYDGRPIKLEGNPRHPANQGTTDVFAQAAVLDLYDPDRSGDVIQREGNRRSVSSWQAFDRALHEALQATGEGGAGLAVLSGAVVSPTLARLRRQLKDRYPACRWVEYEPIGAANEERGLAQVLGRPATAVFEIPDEVTQPVILAVDADFLSEGPDALRLCRQFARTRRGDPPGMSRLYAVETRLSLTGAAADHRLALPPSQIPKFLEIFERMLAGDLMGDNAVLGWPEVELQYMRRFIRALLEDQRRLTVVVGETQPPEVHATAARINAMLASAGPDAQRARVRYVPVDDPLSPQALSELVTGMRSGETRALVILGGNPAYDAPADVPFAETVEQLPFSAHLSCYESETSRRCQWHLPASHFLEAWSDLQDRHGVYSVAQPTIAPIHQTRSAIELLAVMLGERAADAMQLVRTTLAQQLGIPQRDTESPWRQCLEQGFLMLQPPEMLEETAVETDPGPMGDLNRIGELWATLEHAAANIAEDTFELAFAADASVFDGRFANSGWLQEMPDPITRLTWGNAVVMAPAAAQRLSLSDGDRVRVSLGERSIEGGALVLPGVPDGVLLVNLGYGRTAAGHIGGEHREDIAPVGFNAYLLRSTSQLWSATGSRLERLSGKVPLASVQDHYLIDGIGKQGQQQRLGELVREVTYKRLHDREDPYRAEDAVHHPPLLSLWKEHQYEGHRWGMSVDLSACIGCGACVVACQAENNIPVVGPERVREGREMHWIRTDRYFSGPPEAPQVVHQPLMCHHCEMAPCEQVCPVAATVHSSEGLNDMVYNRCIGTRYCANNCPYKVRRFNYFYYHKDLDEPRGELKKLAMNPEVTVRSRGVMEKCTYCVQRIQAVKIRHKNEGETHIPDGEIQTACQQVCPTQAIRFGDLGDPKSDVARLYHNPRSYAMLAELNVKPRTRYLARVRNPHRQLESLEDRGNKHDEHHAG